MRKKYKLNTLFVGIQAFLLIYLTQYLWAVIDLDESFDTNMPKDIYKLKTMLALGEARETNKNLQKEIKEQNDDNYFKP